MAAIPHRGEVKIELEGRTLLMRPTFECLVQIEQATGRPIMDVVRRFADHRFGVTDVTAVIAAGLKGAGAPVTDERVAEMVFNTGFLQAAGPASQLLFGLLNVGLTEVDLAGEEEPDDGPEAGPGKSPAAEG